MLTRNYWNTQEIGIKAIADATDGNIADATSMLVNIVSDTTNTMRQMMGGKLIASNEYRNKKFDVIVSDSEYLTSMLMMWGGAGEATPFIAVHTKYMQMIIEKFGWDVTREFLEFAVAHELRHLGQKLDGAYSAPTDETSLELEIDADSVAISEWGIEKYNTMLEVAAECIRYSAQGDDNAAEQCIDILRARRSAATQTYVKETAPKCVDLYKDLATTIIEALAA